MAGTRRYRLPICTVANATDASISILKPDVKSLNYQPTDSVLPCFKQSATRDNLHHGLNSTSLYDKLLTKRKSCPLIQLPNFGYLQKQRNQKVGFEYPPITRNPRNTRPEYKHPRRASLPMGKLQKLTSHSVRRVPVGMIPATSKYRATKNVKMAPGKKAFGSLESLESESQSGRSSSSYNSEVGKDHVGFSSSESTGSDPEELAAAITIANNTVDSNRSSVTTIYLEDEEDNDIFEDSSDDDETDGDIYQYSLDSLYCKLCVQCGRTPLGTVRKQLDSTLLDLSNCLLGPEDIKPICILLTKHATISSVDLSGSVLGDEGAGYVAEMMRRNKDITHLYIGSGKISPRGFGDICSSLEKHKSLQLLDLSDNKLSITNIKQIADILKVNNNLKELVLRYCTIGEDGAKILGPALADNTSLKRLDVSWNGIRKRGAVVFCNGIMENTCLAHLNLSWNGLDREGAKALEKCLKQNSMLKSLDLTCNRIDYMGLKPLINGLVKNVTLHSLKLSLNPMTTQGAVCILKAIKQSPDCAIKEIDISDVPVNKDFMKCLADLYDTRPIKVIHDEDMHKSENIHRAQTVLNSYDPCMVLFEYMRQESLRLVDLFRVIDKDNSGTLTRQELCQAFVAMNLPLSNGALQLLMQRLDNDDNNEIDINEMKKGQMNTFQKTHAMKNNRDKDHEAILADIKQHVRKAIETKRKKKPYQEKDIISRIERALK